MDDLVIVWALSSFVYDSASNIWGLYTLYSFCTPAHPGLSRGSLDYYLKDIQHTKGVKHHTTPMLIAKFQMVLVNGIRPKFFSNGGKIIFLVNVKWPRNIIQPKVIKN